MSCNCDWKHNTHSDLAASATALQQIRDKQYFEALGHYQGDLLLVGVSYDPKSKEHTCRIEKVKVE